MLRADRDGAPADEISGATGQAEGDESACARVGEGPYLIAKNSGLGVGADR